MTRLPQPGADDGTWGDILNDFLQVEHNADGTLKTSASLATKADNATVLHTAGNETIGGTKTFSVAPVVPTSSFPESAVTNLITDLAATEKAVNKGQPNGYAALDGTGKVPVAQMSTAVVDERTAAVYAAANPVLANGTLGYETDTGILKLGDGVTAWSSLAPINRSTDLAYASLSVARGPFTTIADVTGLSINTVSVPYATKIHAYIGLIYNDLAGGSTTTTTIGAQASIDLNGTARAVDRLYHGIGQAGATGGKAMNLWCDVAANTAVVAKVRIARTGAASGNAQLYADANTLSFIRQVPA